jgi:ferredoxin-NADP reductase/Na+-translocating ferredoxin:NAD+ oxidoreductase RnfD subunit
MYRVVLYYLTALWVIALIFGAFGIMPYPPLTLLFSTFVIFVVCWIVNTVIAKLLRTQTNIESIYITAFILSLIISPIALKPFDFAGFWFLVCAAAFAMASKYILAINKKHIFNPAAIAVVLTGFILGQYASWWIGGNLPMLTFILIGGLLVVRKIQRFDLVLSFGIAALAGILLLNIGFNPLTIIEKIFVHTTLLFFAFVMITEPLTTPPTRPLRILYGAIVGLLFSPGIHLGSIYSSPELALVIGNIFSYAVSPKQKYLLPLTSKTEVGTNTYDFVFALKKPMAFAPGQYMEFTLGHTDSDSRGNRRYFTLASSPTERELHVGVKFYDRSSSFKKHMLALLPGETMLAGQLAGDFVLPNDGDKKLVFIAGGIGITPFRSMIKYLSDRGEKRDAILLYSNKTRREISYRDVFEEAEKTIGLKTMYAITDIKEKNAGGGTDSNGSHYSGRIDAAFIKREIPDYVDRLFYISGTRAMTVGFQKTLQELGVPRHQIKIDFFPGFA